MTAVFEQERRHDKSAYATGPLAARVKPVYNHFKQAFDTQISG